MLLNYRPVSNLPFVSKVLEKIIAAQLTSYMRENGLYEMHQSAYRCYHSTETALVKVQNDMLRAVDDGCGVFLVLLDLSAAFDTLEHKVILSRLQDLGLSPWRCPAVDGLVSARKISVCCHRWCYI